MNSGWHVLRLSVCILLQRLRETTGDIRAVVIFGRFFGRVVVCGWRGWMLAVKSDENEPERELEDRFHGGGGGGLGTGGAGGR